MKKQVLAGVFLLLTAVPSLWATSNSVGFTVSGGQGDSGYSIDGTVGIPPKAETAATQVSLDYAYLHTQIGTESVSRQYTLGLSHKADEDLEGHGSLTYWNDSLNDIHYAGPSFGTTYTWNDAGDEIAALGVDSDIFIYGTDVSASSTTRRVLNPITNRLVKEVVPGGQANVQMTQFRPSLNLEVPFADHRVTPSVTYSHAFYSRNPNDFETLVGRPRFSSSVNSINGLVAGFFNDTVEGDLALLLPAGFEVDGRLGVAQSATDWTWATTQSATITRTFFDHVTAKLDWSRAIQSGISYDIYTGGLTYFF